MIFAFIYSNICALRKTMRRCWQQTKQNKTDKTKQENRRSWGILSVRHVFISLFIFYERRFEGVLPLHIFNGFILLVRLFVINISTTHTHTCSHTAVGTKDVLLRVLSLLIINARTHTCSHTAVGTKDVLLRILSLLIINARTHTCSHTAVRTKDVLLRILSLLIINARTHTCSHTACCTY